MKKVSIIKSRSGSQQGRASEDCIYLIPGEIASELRIHSSTMSSREAMAECQRILDPLSAVTLRRYRMMSAGTLPTMRLGQIVRVPARALERWVEQKTAEIELLDTRAIPEAKEVV
jgi:hypothetical protein